MQSMQNLQTKTKRPNLPDRTYQIKPTQMLVGTPPQYFGFASARLDQKCVNFQNKLPKLG